MATAEMAAMLDELMGRNRNAMPNEKVSSHLNQRERERGQWTDYYPSPQSFILTFSYSLD